MATGFDAIEVKSSATARVACVAIAKTAIKNREKNRFIVHLLDWGMRGAFIGEKFGKRTKLRVGEEMVRFQMFMTDHKSVLLSSASPMNRADQREVGKQVQKVAPQGH
jgi:hypothetical protein